MQPLIETLKDSESTVRAAAAEALGAFAKHKDQAIKPLIESLSDQEAEVRSAAIISLGKLGKNKPDVAEALDRVAEDTDPQVKLNLDIARVCLGTRDEAAIPVLMQGIASNKRFTFEAAIDLLGKIGKA